MNKNDIIEYRKKLYDISFSLFERKSVSFYDSVWNNLDRKRVHSFIIPGVTVARTDEALVVRTKNFIEDLKRKLNGA